MKHALETIYCKVTSTSLSRFETLFQIIYEEKLDFHIKKTR